jgi:hypothetical protein
MMKGVKKTLQVSHIQAFSPQRTRQALPAGSQALLFA